MKKIVLVPFLLLAVLVYSQGGYEIKVTFKPFKNEYVFLGHYSGKQFPVVDSVNLNDRKFTNSPDNDLFNGYQKYMQVKGRLLDSANKALKASPAPKDSVALV